MTDLIPRVKVESQHYVGWPTCHDFPRFVIIPEISRPEVRSHWWRSPKICPFGRKTPLMGKFWHMFSERIHGDIDPRLVCKFHEIWLTGNRQSRALFSWQKKTKYRLCSHSRFCVDHAQNLSGPAPGNMLGVPHISSESVHFRRSYSRTHEHCWNVQQCFQYSAKLLHRVITGIDAIAVAATIKWI